MIMSNADSFFTFTMILLILIVVIIFLEQRKTKMRVYRLERIQKAGKKRLRPVWQWLNASFMPEEVTILDLYREAYARGWRPYIFTGKRGYIWIFVQRNQDRFSYLVEQISWMRRNFPSEFLHVSLWEERILMHIKEHVDSVSLVDTPVRQRDEVIYDDFKTWELFREREEDAHNIFKQIKGP